MDNDEFEKEVMLGVGVFDYTGKCIGRTLVSVGDDVLHVSLPFADGYSPGGHTIQYPNCSVKLSVSNNGSLEGITLSEIKPCREPVPEDGLPPTCDET